MGIKSREVVFFVFIVFAFLSAFFFIRDRALFVDEEVHYLQIQRFIHGDFEVYDIITVIPGYHYLFSFTARVFSFYTIGEIRMLNAIAGLISVFVFLLLVFRIHGEKGLGKGLEYVFFPILFPFFFLIYTDVLSLLMVLAMLYFVLMKRYKIAGIFGIFAFFVRQNNVVWMAFMVAFVYIEENGWKFDIRKILELLKKTWVFVFGLVAALCFFIYNRGFSLGDRAMHESGFYLGNIFFILFLFFFLFLPMNIGNFWKIKHFVKKNKWIWFVVLGIFFIYMKFFVVNHPYNLKAQDYFLRNLLLHKFMIGNLIKTILFFPIAYSILSLCIIRLKRKEFYLFYLFAILSLIPMGLIEQRYYLIPFSLFILFKEGDKSWIEMVTICFYVILSVVLFYLIGEVKFFL